MPLILVTNDDGFFSPGITALADALRPLGDVITVAPQTEASAVGHALTLRRPLRLEQERPNVYSVDGTPTDCVNIAIDKLLKQRPDIVVSGINAGLNTGRAILHSGTVGAALTAQNFGAKGLAVSVEAKEPWRWDTAATIALEVLELLIEAPDRSVLNLNVPARARADIEDVRWARLAAFGSVRAAIGEMQTDGSLQIELQATGEQLPPDTDTALCAAGYATLTTLVGIAESWPPEQAETTVAQRPVPGAPVEALHSIPDAADSRTLRSRERA